MLTKYVIETDGNPYNFELLNEELTIILDASFLGLNDGPPGLQAIFIGGYTLSQEDKDAIFATFAAHDDTANSIGQQLRTNVRATAISAVGVALTDLTQGQIKALVAILLWQQGAVANDGTINPLSDWVN